MLTRRGFLAATCPAALAAPDPATRYRTAYKYGKLVLAASKEPGAFDGRTVDCPFVFHHNGRFYMTYVGWDGRATKPDSPLPAI